MTLVGKTSLLYRGFNLPTRTKPKSLFQFQYIRSRSQVPEYRKNSISSTTTCTICHKLFSTSSVFQLPGFQFGHGENKNADDFIRNAPAYKGLVFHPFHLDSLTSTWKASATSTTTTTFHPVVERFIQLALNPENVKLSITAEVNKGVADEVLLNLKSMKDSDLLQVLYHLRFFAPCPSAKDPDYFRIWGALDEECVSRMLTWTFDYLFVVADLWNGLFLSRASAFHWNVVKKCFRKCGRLTKEQFIRFMFCLNLNRKLPESMNTYDMEFYLNKVADKLSAQEVAIVAMAFFKTETALKDPKVLEKLLEVAIKEAKTLDSIEVAAVAKLTRFSSSPQSREIVLRLQQAFLPELERLSIPACTHLALVGTSSQMPHLELVNAVVKKTERNIKDARLKELERMALAMTMFNADCDELCRLIVDELRTAERAEEIRTYGRCLPAILHYLSLREVFPQDLISMALAEGFRKTYYGSKWEIYQRELLCLDFAVELEVPNYSGARLDLKTREKLAKINFKRVSPASKSRVSLSEKALRMAVQAMEAALGGSEFVYPCNILPQHSSIEIVYCTDDQGKAVKVPQDFRITKDFEIKYIPSGNEGIYYHAVFLCTRNIALHMNGLEAKLSGQGSIQVRQLQKMGYCVHTMLATEVDEDRIKMDITTILAQSSSHTEIFRNHASVPFTRDQIAAQPELSVLKPIRAF